jgi:hypothetical protein
VAGRTIRRNSVFSKLAIMIIGVAVGTTVMFNRGGKAGLMA